MNNSNGTDGTLAAETAPTESMFATAINCTDGRVQTCVIEAIRIHLAVQYVDVITEPGADGIMAYGPPETIEEIRRKVALSVARHQSRTVAVVAHHDCLGNPVSQAEHLECLKRAVERIIAWGLNVRVFGLWVNERWKPEVVLDTGRGGERCKDR